MFHFKRRTLWIIIYVTIPLILVLNSLGPETNDADSTERVVTPSDIPALHWTLADLQPDCAQHCRLDLDASQQVRISALLASIPAGAEPVPDGVDLAFTQRAGYGVASLTFVSTPAMDARVLEFLRVWLPQNQEPRWVVTGAVTDAFWQSLQQTGVESIGAARPLELPPPSALTVLTAPQFGTDQQLAYLLWVEILKQRLAGYRVTVTWDHRRENSLILFNTTLSSDVLYPVTEAEWQPVQAAYLRAAAQPDRTEEQIHRYVLTALLYDVPFEFFTRQSARLQQVALVDIDQSRENTLAQIQQ